MSPSEIGRRARDQAVKLVWQVRWAGNGRRLPEAVMAAAGVFRATLTPAAASTVPPSARDRLVRAADEVMEGRWRIFEVERHDLAAPDWFLDPRTGRKAPARTFSFSIDHRREPVTGNAKYVWELSRHHHLTMLAAAYFVTRNERYADRVTEHLRGWWEQNAFLRGVHWTSGIEVGMRLVSWVWIRRLLEGSPLAAESFEQSPLFLRQLLWHQRYLSGLPSHGSSANNHLIAELAGQFTAACAFPYFETSAKWQRRSAVGLRRELARQTFPCGLNREQATAYHGFVLELALAAAIEGEAAGSPLGPDTWSVIQAMTDALAAVVDVAGRPPRQGDTDDASGLLLDAPDYRRWTSLLATGERLFGRPDWWPSIEPDDVRTALWAPLVKSLPRLAGRPTARRTLFRDAGLVILRDRPDSEDEIWCTCDSGPLGYLSIAGHGHADALAVECRVGGIEILADPGTYCYYGEPQWRAYFRSTAAHNTLEVAGVDQSLSGGAFLWLRHAQSRLLSAHGLDEGRMATWSAEHDGYASLVPPAIHRRSVHLDRADRILTITDSLQTTGPQACQLTFHLGPAVSVSLEGARARLRWDTAKGFGAGVLELPDTVEWMALRGQARPPLGWYSPRFGERQPTTSLVGRGTLGLGEVLITRLRFMRLGCES